jgi:glutathione S-transferase
MVEKGLAWEDRNVDLMAGEQFSPDYLKIHPKGIVPAIVQRRANGDGVDRHSRIP